MIPAPKDNTRILLRSALFLGAAVVQAICLIHFVLDVLGETSSPDRMTLVETVSVIGLMLSIAFILREHRALLTRNRRVEHALHAATGAFATVMDTQFTP